MPDEKTERFIDEEIENRFPADLVRIATLFLLLYCLAALGFSYWGVIRAPELLSRDDNPRLVEAELRVYRGTILDRNGIALAQTEGDLGGFYRNYLSPSSPVVGYYSLRYGVAGIESAYDEILRGQSKNSWENITDSILHRYPAGSDVKLTLDAQLQRTADQALGNLTGAIILLEASSGHILSVVSHPGFDPNQLGNQYESLNVDGNSPLVNRAMQGLYQPGSALQPFILGMVLERGLASVDDNIKLGSMPIQVDGVWLTCAVEPPDDLFLRQAVGYSCPAPFNELAGKMNWNIFIENLEDFGFFENLALPLVLAKGVQSETLENGGELRAEVLGQGNLTISPLEMAWALMTLANDGKRLPLQLVQSVGSNENGWEVVIPSGPEEISGISMKTLETVKSVMLESVDSGAAKNAGSDKIKIAGHVGIAVSGPEKANHSWFLGFTVADNPQNTGRYVVLVLLEGIDDGALAAGIGGHLLEDAVE